MVQTICLAGMVFGKLALTKILANLLNITFARLAITARPSHLEAKHIAFFEAAGEF